MFKNFLEKLSKILLNFDNFLSNNKMAKRIILSFFCIFLLIFAYVFLNYKDLNEVYNLENKVKENISGMRVVAGGETVGIKLLASGVLIMGIDRTEEIDLKIGDIILSVNGTKIESNSELDEFVKNSNGKELTLEINRSGQEFKLNISPIYDSISESYKLGLWVKDSSAGVGTITFYELNSNKFAALGHGVTETKENYILPITSGGITSTTIYSVKKGIAKVPGELKGSITNKLLGQIEGNTDKGIYGSITEKEFLKEKEEIEILTKTKVKEGKATILATLDDNQKKEYEIKIEKVLLTSSGNKNMIIKVTDEALLEKTGGIVQGMSGSPIIQDGKLVGAVTHVFLNDPTRGYGVFIENMLEDMCTILK